MALKIRKIKIDPKIVRRFDIKVGPKETDRFSTARHKLDWTKSTGPDSGWEDIQELAETIKTNGMWHTPMVMEYKGNYYAIHGWRRIRSAVANKIPEIEVNLVEGLTLEQAEAISFKENYTYKKPSDEELGDILWRAHLRHPDWTLAQIGEFYGVGGPDPRKRAKKVESYIRHRLFLERHKDELREIKTVRPLSRGDTQIIQTVAREITGVKAFAVNGKVPEEQEEMEVKILRAAAETGIQPQIIARKLKEEREKGVEIKPEEAAELVKTGAIELPAKKTYHVTLELEQDLAEALKKWELKRNPKAEHFYYGIIIIDFLRENLKKQGFL